METKANHLLIGSFVLGMLMLAFGFVYWMSNFGTGGSKRYYVVFEGGVSGLNTASNVLFNGLRVGKVQSLALDPEDARKVKVLIAINGDTPVRANSRARVEAQGLTGGGAIQLSPGTPDAAFLVATDDKDIPVIKADRASSASLFDAAPEVMGNANALLVRLNDLVANNEDSIRKIITNVESFTGVLEQKKDDMGAVIANARLLSEDFRRVADKIEKAVDKVGGDGNSFLVEAQNAATSFRQLAEKLDKSFGDNSDGVVRVAKNGLQEFEMFMRDGRRAAQSLDRVLEKLERNPQMFLFGGQSVPEYNPGRNVAR